MESLKQSFTIVIAEDNHAMGVLVERMLKRSSFVTHRTGSGAETLDYCRTQPPETTFLLLDYNLGDMTAKDIVLQFQQQGQHFPFIVMTGYGSEKVAVDMMKLGAEDYIIKNEQAVELLVRTLTQAIERRHTQLALVKTQQALETAHQAITAAENGIMIVQMDNLDQPIIYYNPAFEHITGYQSGPAYTLTGWLTSYHQQDQPGLSVFHEPLQTRSARHFQLRRDDAPHPHWHDVSVSFSEQPADHPILIAIVTDTTQNYLNEQENRRLRERLEQTQRLAVAGQIARELAHEVGHPLTLISSKIQFMIARHSPETDSLSIILQHIDRITNLLRRFASDSSETLVLANCSIESIIESVLSLCPPRDDISIAVEIDDNLPNIMADKAKITQVLLNLLVNAFEACKNGGRIILSAWIKMNADDHKPYAAISIQDSGCGIAPEHRSKIFDPFFSTKSTSPNRGLGLPICQTIAKRHQGWIDVQSKLNNGTRFTLMLPLTPAASAQPVPGDRPAPLFNTVLRRHDGHDSGY